MVSGVLWIMAGIIYVLWQVHKDSPGALTMVLIACVVTCGPIVLWEAVMKANLTIGAIGIIIHCIAVIGFCIYGATHGTKWAADEAEESCKIWREVNELPLPDEQTLRAYKIACKIPLYPEDNEVYNKAALRAWRVNEYNKRYKKKHKIVTYI